MSCVRFLCIRGSIGDVFVSRCMGQFGFDG